MGKCYKLKPRTFKKKKKGAGILLAVVVAQKELVGSLTVSFFGSLLVLELVLVLEYSEEDLTTPTMTILITIHTKVLVIKKNEYSLSNSYYYSPSTYNYSSPSKYTYSSPSTNTYA